MDKITLTDNGKIKNKEIIKDLNIFMYLLLYFWFSNFLSAINTFT